MGFNMTKAEWGLIGSKKAALLAKERLQGRIIDYKKNPTLCLFCKNPLDYEKRKHKFCSHSCSQKLHNIGIRRHGNDPKKCLLCNNDFRHSGKFCSSKCFHGYSFKKWVEKIEKLGYFEGFKGNDSGGGVAKPKKYVLQKQNGRCSICGINEWLNKPVPFVLDHIDGDSTNWKIENIRVICRNCNGQLPTYCGRNRGRGKRTVINLRGKDGIYTHREKR